MRDRSEIFEKEIHENGSSTIAYNEHQNELQLINEILIETYLIEDIDRMCKLVGEAVHKLNKDCYVLVSLYDSSINAVRIRAAIGFEGLTKKI